MLVLGGAGVLVVAVCLHLAWVAKRAVARGRNAWAWVALALVLGAAGLRAGVALFLTIADVDNDALMALFGTAPITLVLAPMIIIVLVLDRLPVHVATMNSYPVFAQVDGAGTLVIGRRRSCCGGRRAPSASLARGWSRPRIRSRCGSCGPIARCC